MRFLDEKKTSQIWERISRFFIRIWGVLNLNLVLKDIKITILTWLANLRNHYSSHRLKLKDKSLLKAGLKEPKIPAISYSKYGKDETFEKIWEIRTYEISRCGHPKLRSNYILNKWLVRWGKFSILLLTRAYHFI